MMSDSIGRQEAIDTAIEAADAWDGGSNKERERYIREALEKLQPIQSERNKGHWIKHEYADIVEGYYVPNYECSECHSWKRDDSDFCPDCGADMR